MKTYNGLRCLFVVLFFALAFSASYARQSMTGWKKEATVSLSVSTVNDPAHPGKNTTWVLTISGSPTVANGGAVSFVVYKIKDENGNTVHTQVGSVPSFNATVLGNGGSDTQYTSEPGGCLPDPGQYEIDWSWERVKDDGSGLETKNGSTTYTVNGTYKVTLTSGLSGIAGDTIDATYVQAQVQKFQNGSWEPAANEAVALSSSNHINIPGSVTTGASGYSPVPTTNDVKSSIIIKDQNELAVVTAIVHGATTTKTITLYRISLTISITYPTAKHKLYVYSGSAYTSATVKATVSGGGRPVQGTVSFSTAGDANGGNGTGGANVGTVAHAGFDFTATITGAGPTGTCYVTAQFDTEPTIKAQTSTPVRFPDTWYRSVTSQGGAYGASTVARATGTVFANVNGDGKTGIDGIPQIPVQITVTGLPSTESVPPINADDTGNFNLTSSTGRICWDGRPLQPDGQTPASNTDGSVALTAGPLSYNCFIHYINSSGGSASYVDPNFKVNLGLYDGKIKAEVTSRPWHIGPIEITPTFLIDTNSVTPSFGLTWTPKTSNQN